MWLLHEPRLDYKPTSNVVFRHGNLLDELRNIRKHHTSVVNQVIHIFSTVLALAFVQSTILLIGKLISVPLPVLFIIVASCFAVPYLGFFLYLDWVIYLFWVPLFFLEVFGSAFIAKELENLMPRYAAIPASLGLALVALVPQFLGHLLLEKVRFPPFEPFELFVLTPFFLGYCTLGWISCWQIRKETTERIWKDDDSPNVVGP